MDNSEKQMLAQYGAQIMLVVLVLLTGYLLYTWQHNHPVFDLADLLTGDNGRVSLNKFSQVTALVVSTWGFAALVQQGKLSEVYFIGYMSVWTGARHLQAYFDKKPTPKE